MKTRREKPQEAYIRWWKGKLCRVKYSAVSFRRVKEVKWIGPPSGFYGCVNLVFEDGTDVMVPAKGFRPTKQDVEVQDER